MLDVILVPWPGFPNEFSDLIPLWFLGEGFPSILLCQVSPRAHEVFVVLSPFSLWTCIW